jgi:hypothetical protein
LKILFKFMTKFDLFWSPYKMIPNVKVFVFVLNTLCVEICFFGLLN